MRDDLPQVIKDVGFDFSWDEQKVWALNVPAIQMPIEELTWHFDVPFLWEGGGIYNLTPWEVMEHPELYQEEYARMLAADLRHPIDIMENKGRWLILDGLHRLMRIYFEFNWKRVLVRIIPRERIPEIMK